MNVLGICGSLLTESKLMTALADWTRKISGAPA